MTDEVYLTQNQLRDPYRLPVLLSTPEKDKESPPPQYCPDCRWYELPSYAKGRTHEHARCRAPSVHIEPSTGEPGFLFGYDFCKHIRTRTGGYHCRGYIEKIPPKKTCAIKLHESPKKKSEPPWEPLLFWRWLFWVLFVSEEK